jgi:hypothetical protein
VVPEGENLVHDHGSSIRATGREVLPKSIPMTGPRIFLSASSAYFRTNDDPYGVRRRFDERVAEEAALGSYQAVN